MNISGLIKRYLTKSGQKDDFENLLTEHFDGLSRLALRLTPQASDAEDLLQEFVIKVYDNQADFLRAPNKKAYLLRALNNLYIDQWRGQKNSPLNFAEHEEALNDYASETPSTERLVNSEQLQTRLKKSIALLPEERRMVLVMHDIEGYSLPEISSLLNIPQGTLKSRLHRARSALRAELSLDLI